MIKQWEFQVQRADSLVLNKQLSTLGIGITRWAIDRECCPELGDACGEHHPGQCVD